MDEPKMLRGQVMPVRMFSVRDLLAIGFRQKRLVFLSFIAVVIGTLAMVVTMPPQYRSQMKILVKRERTDPMVTPDAVGSPKVANNVTEEELNSEVELLKSSDLLAKVALASGLPQQHGGWRSQSRLSEIDSDVNSPIPPEKTAKAVAELRSKLRVETVPKTYMISVTYDSTNPEFSAAVLQHLATSYLEKHIEVHRPAGAMDFFRKETERYRAEWNAAKKRLSRFNRTNGVVSASVEKQNALEKLSEFQGQRRQAQAAVRETEGRIRALEQQQRVTPARLVTQVRTSEPAVVQQLKATLLNLELKHTEMLASFSPDYRPVQDLANQIKQARAALEAEQSKPVREEVTDRDATHQWLSSELARNRSELASLKERDAAFSRIEELYQDRARQLDETDTGQQDSLLDVKTAQDNYLLYLRKEEEARISQALDRQRIINVAVAEAPSIPVSSTNPRGSAVVLGILLAVMVSVTLALVSDYMDPSFRTPDEIETILQVPVVAVVKDHGPRGYLDRFLWSAAESDDEYRALPAP